jgi:hypothetical protein
MSISIAPASAPAEIGAKPKRRWQHRSDEKQQPTSKDAADDGAKRILVCVRCSQRITSVDNAIEISGLHEHSQVNPHGFIWNFRCFSSAPGCKPSGGPQTEFTWFAGYAWQLENCVDCRLHLGWSFHAEADRFYGLITERLVEVDEDDES